MSLNNILITDSFEAIKPHLAEVIGHFCDVLFTRRPDLRRFYSESQIESFKKIYSFHLKHAVEFLNEPDHLRDYFRKLGSKHSVLLQSDELIEGCVQSMLSTFRYYFEDQWTPECSASWSKLFEFVTGEMKLGIQQSKKQIATNSNLMALEKKAREEIERYLASKEFDQYLSLRIREKVKEALSLELESPCAELNSHITT